MSSFFFLTNLVPVAERGVVFFRNQDLCIDDQKLLGRKLGRLTGAPEASGLYKHPMLNSGFMIPLDDTGRQDDEVQQINILRVRQEYKSLITETFASANWHADNPWEPVPSDYAVLKLTNLPEEVGGDTLWASAYEAYDRLSPPFQKLAEGLMVTHHSKAYDGMDYIKGYRGHPENVGTIFKATQCVLPL